MRSVLQNLRYRMPAVHRQFHAGLYANTAHLLLLAILCVFSVFGLKLGSALLGLSVPGVPFASAVGRPISARRQVELPETEDWSPGAATV